MLDDKHMAILIAIIWLPVIIVAMGYVFVESNRIHCATRGIDHGYTVEEINQICEIQKEEN